MLEVLESIIRSGTQSKATDRLIVLLAALPLVSKEKLDKVSRFQLDWEEVDGDVVPTVKIEFFP